MKIHVLSSLRARLIFWYIGTLTVFTIFFYVVVHILALPHGTAYFIVLFIVLAGVGLSVIYAMTSSISYLSHRIKHISRKNLDERIRDIPDGDEIGDLAASFNNLLERISAAFTREQQFIADVAHELKTPLSTINSSLEIALTKKRNTSEYKEVLENVLDETKRLSSMLKNVLDLAWTETYDDQKKGTLFNLSELFDEISDISEKMAHLKQLKVKPSIQPHITIEGFRDKLGRAIMNIVDNAITYTHEGTVRLTLNTHQADAVITITDTGQGIPQKDVPRIFDRFYRGSQTDRIGGSGLGLSIAKSVISLHGGTLSVSSKLHRGTTFIVTLPLRSS